MRVTLVLMPWYTPDGPAPAIGTVAADLRMRRPQDHVREWYANLDWADYAWRASDGELDLAACMEIVDNGFTESIGDWVFAGALHGEAEWQVEEYSAYLRERGRDPRAAVTFHKLAPGFVAALAQSIIDEDPDVVGFSSTYNQNVPSLALASELKRRRPGLPIVFGGANCQPPQGAALQRNFPFIDYAVAGEGERAFPALLDCIEAGREPVDVPGISWWSKGNQSAAGSPRVLVQRTNSPRMINLTEEPAPHYDAYYQRFASSTLHGQMSQYLILESSRGCWWGAKHQCTFCGLNDIAYRSKTPEQSYDEIERLLARHQVLDLIMTDNIIEMGYFHTLLPRLAEADWDLRMVYSIKANLDRRRLELMHAAGAFHVQPGIESLASATLRLMDKGVTASQNVQLLRDCTEIGMEVGWSQLYGFPGETARDYAPILAQTPALVHIAKPLGAFRISLERYSPLFDQGANVFDWVKPAECYKYIYGDADLTDMVYVYDYAAAGIDGATERALVDVVAHWRANNAASSLEQRKVDGALVIADRRVGWPLRDIAISDPAQVAVYERLRVAAIPETLRKHLAEAGFAVDVEAITGWLADWRAQGLVFEDEGRFVALATISQPVASLADALFGWRRGPGFAVIDDARDPERVLRHVIDGPYFAAFDAIARDEPPPAEVNAKVLDELREIGFIESTPGGWRALPPRRRTAHTDLARFASPVLFGKVDERNLTILPMLPASGLAIEPAGQTA